MRDLRRAFESQQDDSFETQSKDILPNMRGEAESQMQADIKEGISQVCSLDIVCDATFTD